MSDKWNEIKLEKLRWTLMTHINEEIAGEIVNAPQVDVQHDNYISDLFAVRAIFDFLGANMESISAKYPANWKQAIKERFAPEWVKRRWPVRYTVVTLFARELYPRMKLPDRDDGMIAFDKTYREEFG